MTVVNEVTLLLSCAHTPFQLYIFSSQCMEISEMEKNNSDIVFYFRVAFKTNKTKEAMQRSVTNRLNSYLFRSQKRDRGKKKKREKS